MVTFGQPPTGVGGQKAAADAILAQQMLTKAWSYGTMKSAGKKDRVRVDYVSLLAVNILVTLTLNAP
eukprot:CAMPEP_0197461268 /NCGR_PEP_ID=MMETSP1175-20131217/56037_1 /TAXON_ID=1003142 /ORGANISM="Triceratium dubium, Strain CCMP147" /LENGTH=66 /DNA_ID=CAMNT_0042996513 /DNA_START=621 /DNA_END=817 /DNA_ORIENTATION=+